MRLYVENIETVLGGMLVEWRLVEECEEAQRGREQRRSTRRGWDLPAPKLTSSMRTPGGTRKWQ